MNARDNAYFASPALSKSRIDLLLDCPARYKADIDGDVEEKDSEALRFGSMAHTLILEREDFSTQYIVTDVSLATKEGKALKANAESKGLELIKGKDFEKALNMAEAVWEHPQATVLFSNPHIAEKAIYWDFDGIHCKAKPDIVTTLPDGRLIVGDLKTTESASIEHIRKSIANFGYHRQAAWYLLGMEMLGKKAEAFVFMFVEKKKPHLVTTVELDQTALDTGMEECRKAIDTLKECTKTGIWPCYSRIIETITLPSWYSKNINIVSLPDETAV